MSKKRIKKDLDDNATYIELCQAVFSTEKGKALLRMLFDKHVSVSQFSPDTLEMTRRTSKAELVLEFNENLTLDTGKVTLELPSGNILDS